jgi:hypothetical protein
MKTASIIKIMALLWIVLSSSFIYANSISKPLRIEKSLTYSEAKKLGFRAEITSTAVRHDLLEFRIAVPENVHGKKVDRILSEIFNSEKSVALLHMNTYSQEKKNILGTFTNSEPEYQRYFYMNINQKIITRTILSVSCEGGYVYIMEVNISDL